MPISGVVRLDNLRTVPQALLVETLTTLDAARMDQICRALIRSTGC